MSSRPTPAKHGGYTLVELMIVVIIIAIISAIAAPAIMEGRKNSVLGEAARRTQEIFETARARALMRNAAMRVVIDKGTVSTPGSIWLTESTSNSCRPQTGWPDASDVTGRYHLQGLDLDDEHFKRFHIYMSELRIGSVSYDPATNDKSVTGSSANMLDLCLNRRGRMLRNTGSYEAPVWIPLNTGSGGCSSWACYRDFQVVIGFQRQDGGADVGVERLVVVKQGAVSRIMR
jgi:prepilin-type N-terminal cleavage/methylation domain-containing protein